MTYNMKDRNYLFVLFALCMLSILPVERVYGVPGENAAADYYVAVDGNDAWSGRLPEPNNAGTDGPFATLERARDAARKLKSTGWHDSSVTVMVRGGTYFRKKPFVLLPEDSGTEEYPVIYTAWPDEKPVISGGKRITGWQKGENGIWYAEVPEVKSGEWYFRQLFVSKQRCRRARIPKTGALEIPAGADPARQGFQFKEGDINPGWTNLKDVEIVILQAWMESRLLIDHIDSGKNIVMFTGRSWRPLTWNKGYFIENVYEGLDEPGEWYLNRQTGIVSYLPRPGEDMTRDEVIAPRTGQLLRLEGNIHSGEYVKHLAIRGLTFRYTSWTLPEKGYSYPQAELSWPQEAEGQVHPQAQGYVGSVIYGDGVRNCRFEDNDLSHFGTWGIELWRGCKDNYITRNHIYDVGAGGIKSGEPVNAETDEEETSRIVISDNLIHDGCNVYLGAPAIWVGQSSGDLIAHNEVYGAWQWAISVGWRWSYMPPTRARDNIVEYNHCHHLGDSELGTHAVIYSLGVQPGSVIRYNLVHHMLGRGHGICLDNGSAGVVVENNIVHHGHRGGWIGNYNDLGNIVQNNIFAFGKGAQMIRHGDRPPKGQKVDQTGIFYRNIFYWNDDVLFRSEEWTNYDIIMDYNLYYDASGKPVQFLSYTFDEWNEKGLDTHSIVADPLFVDPENGDFTLKPQSPAFRLGFKPIDLSEVGPRTNIEK